MVRCGVCQKIHLAADNIGWFQNNLEKNHEGKVQKKYDPVAIVRFLQAALGVEKQEKSKIRNEFLRDTLEMISLYLCLD